MASRKKTAAAPVEKQEEKTTPDHGVKDVKTMLNELSGEGWGDTEERSMSEVPDGKYQISIDEATVGSSKSSGRLQVSWELTIVSGAAKGRKFFKHDGLDTPENRSWFRGSLARLGVEWPKNPKELPSVLVGLRGSFAQVTAKTKADSDRQNVYFDKALDKADIGESAITSSAGKDQRPAGKTAAKAAEVDPDARPPKNAPEPEASDAGDGDDDLKVDVKFTEDDMTPRQTKMIDELAKKAGYSAGDYANRADLLADIAENEFNAEGVFDNPQDLLNACTK